MPFPETKRVIYKRNPLTKVICQLRFPPILRIDTEVPSLFQEAIRNSFPLYNEKVELMQTTAVGLTKTASNRNHEFCSDDSIWKINLTRTFLSISTSQYHHWEEFIEKFLISTEALLSIYHPPFFTRVGLRYINVFDRSALELNDANWTELLKPYFLGLLSTEIGNEVQNCENVYEVKLRDNDSIVRIATSFVQNAKSKEQCYMVDNDFHCPKKLKTDDLGGKLDFLHERSTRLIQWIITEKLHNAMEPESL